MGDLFFFGKKKCLMYKIYIILLANFLPILVRKQEIISVFTVTFIALYIALNNGLSKNILVSMIYVFVFLKLFKRKCIGCSQHSEVYFKGTHRFVKHSLYNFSGYCNLFN